ncbi:MAG: hypothetical protein ACEPOW_03080 [Bacteroidales bacterium]
MNRKIIYSIIMAFAFCISCKEENPYSYETKLVKLYLEEIGEEQIKEPQKLLIVIPTLTCLGCVQSFTNALDHYIQEDKKLCLIHGKPLNIPSNLKQHIQTILDKNGVFESYDYDFGAVNFFELKNGIVKNVKVFSKDSLESCFKSDLLDKYINYKEKLEKEGSVKFNKDGIFCGI